MTCKEYPASGVIFTSTAPRELEYIEVLEKFLLENPKLQAEDGAVPFTLDKTVAVELAATKLREPSGA